MKGANFNHISVATPFIADSLAVIASEARQSRMVGDSLDCRVAMLLAKTMAKADQ